MAERSNKIFALALTILLIDLWAEGFTNMGVKGFILVAIALNLYGAYSSISKAPFEIWWIHTSLAYVCSILAVVTFFLPVASLSLSPVAIRVSPLMAVVAELHVLGGLISFYAGRCARNELSEYQKRIEEELRPKDPGLAIT